MKKEILNKGKDVSINKAIANKALLAGKRQRRVSGIIFYKGTLFDRLKRYLSYRYKQEKPIYEYLHLGIEK